MLEKLADFPQIFNVGGFDPETGIDWDGWDEEVAAEDEATGLINVYCPTGEGGGVDPSCSPAGATRVMMEKLREKGGFTFIAGERKYKNIGTKGFAVSPYQKRSVVYNGEVKLSDVRKFMRENKDLLQKEGHAVGAWHDEKTGKTHLDVSIVTKDRDHAREIAREHKQIAFFDFKTGKEVRIRATKEATHNYALEPGRDGRGDRDGAERTLWQEIENVYCATGPGGGKDPSCSPGGAAKADEYAWESKASDAEKKALVDYSGEEGTAEGINYRLRHPDEPSNLSPELQSHLDAEFKTIEGAFAKQPDFEKPVTVYRSIWLSTMDEADARKLMDDFENARQSNGIVTMKGLTSTSTWEDVAARFGGRTDGEAFLQIEACKGLGIDKIAKLGEAEMLLDHNSRYRVTSVEKLKPPYGTREQHYTRIGLTQICGEAARNRLFVVANAKGRESLPAHRMVCTDPAEFEFGHTTENVFCATGVGGGVKPDCPGSSVKKVNYRGFLTDVFVNPSGQDLKNLVRDGGKGLPIGLIHDGNVYVWESKIDSDNYLFHDTMFHEVLNLEGDTSGQDHFVIGTDGQIYTHSGKWDKSNKELRDWGERHKDVAINVFCATGEGGGVDPSCGKGEVPEAVKGTILAEKLEPAKYHDHAVKLMDALDDEHKDDPEWWANVAAVKVAMANYPMIHATELENIPKIASDGLESPYSIGREGRLKFDALSGMDRTVFMRMGQAGGGGIGAVGVMIDPKKLDEDKFIITRLGAMGKKEEMDAFLRTPGDHSALVSETLKPFSEGTIGLRDLQDVQARLLVHGYQKDHPEAVGKRLEPEKIVDNDRGEMEVKYAGKIPTSAIVAYFAGDQKLPDRGMSASEYLKSKGIDKVVEYHGEGLHDLSRAYRQHYARFVKNLLENAMPGIVIDPSEVFDAEMTALLNVFCSTGVGGGVDPSCGKNGEGVGKETAEMEQHTKLLKYASVKELRDERRGIPIKCGKDLDKAAVLLAAGKRVELGQPDQVSSLLHKLNDIAKEAKEKGENAPTYDLCKVSVPDTNLFCKESKGIPRINMPQLKGEPMKGSEADKMPRAKIGKNEVDVGEKFIDYLKAKGIKTDDTTVRASHLRASQNELDGAKVAGMMNAAEKGKLDLKGNMIFVTRDNYILDGHHRWAAAVGYGYEENKDLKMPVHRIDMDIGTAIHEANEYTKNIGIKQKAVGK